MSEYGKPTTEKEFDSNFEQIKPVMNATEAHYESSRCLYCFDAPCVTACPTGIDIPQFIRQINTQNISGSAKTIYDSNWLGNACGKVCPTEVLCEGACVYNHQDVKPIEIGRLQNFATDAVIERKEQLYTLAPKIGKKIAIIGAGPAGIACACELSLMGYDVEIFEAKEKPSGLTVYGVAPYKILNEEVLKEMEYLQDQFGYTVHYNQPIKGMEDLSRLEREFDAVFLGIGLGETRSIRIEGETLENCVGATEFIEELKMDHLNTPVGKRVIVIGGGNTAMDAASESARMGAEHVILAYRRGKDEMGAYEFEYDLAKAVGVKGVFNIQPVEILGNGKVEGVRFIRTKVENGKVVNVPGSEFTEACDMVVRATGQAKQETFLDQIDGLELEWGKIIVNEHFQTTNPKYFAGGDAVNGGAEVVNAAAHGKVAAKGINAYLSGS